MAPGGRVQQVFIHTSDTITNFDMLAHKTDCGFYAEFTREQENCGLIVSVFQVSEWTSKEDQKQGQGGTSDARGARPTYQMETCRECCEHMFLMWTYFQFSFIYIVPHLAREVPS